MSRRDSSDKLIVSAFVVGLMAIATYHFIVLHSSGAPTGGDLGNWLTLGYRFVGQGVPNGTQSTYPPVVPLLTVGVVSGLGALAGTNLLAAIVGLAPATGAYIVLRRAGLRWAALIMCLVLAAARSSGEAVAWGGLPQLLGIGIGLVLLDDICRLLRAPSVGRGWRVGFLFLALGATSHLILVQVSLAVALLILLHLAVVCVGLTIRGPWGGRCGWFECAKRCLLPSAVLVPLYLTLVGTVGTTVVANAQTSLAQALQGVDDVFADARTLWVAAAVVTLVSPLFLWPHRRSPLWLEGTSLTLAVIASILLTHEDRFLFLLPLSIMLTLGAWQPELKLRGALTPVMGQGLLSGVAAGLSAWLVFAGLRQFPDEQRFYGQRLFPAATVQDLTTLRDRTPPGSLVAVPPVYGLPWGWWVEGLARRPTMVGALPQYLNFPEERHRAERTDALFSLTTARPEEVLADAQQLGISYLYIPKTWGGGGTTSVGRLVKTFPSRLVLDDGGSVIIRTSP